jgi:hypothetical protein
MVAGRAELRNLLWRHDDDGVAVLSGFAGFFDQEKKL